MDNTVSSATGFTPNYLTTGREIDLGQQPAITRGGDLVANAKAAVKIAFRSLKKNQVRMERQLNKLRNQNGRIAVRDWVMLESDRIVLPGHSVLSVKYRPKYLGPFKVINEESRENFALKLPMGFTRLHPWFLIQKPKLYMSAGGKDLMKDEALSRKDSGSGQRSRLRDG